VRGERELKRREEELESKLLELEQKAKANGITLDAQQPPPALQRCSARRTATAEDRKTKLAALLMERTALLSLRQNSAAYDLVLGSRASQALHSQAYNSTRLAQIDKQVLQLERALGLADSWTLESPDFIASKLEVIRVSDTVLWLPPCMLSHPSTAAPYHVCLAANCKLTHMCETVGVTVCG
jgi:hypothetical protein